MIIEGQLLVIVDTHSEKIVRKATMEHEPEFIKWLSDSHLVIVDSAKIVVWDMNSFKLIHERPEALKNYQVVDIDFSKDGWFVLSGIIPKDGRICGKIFRSDKTIKESVEGFCGTFLRFSFSTDPFYAYYTRSNGAHINLIGLNNSSKKFSLEVFVSSDQERDFPIYMTKSSQLDMIYVIMKSGHVHVYDVLSKSCIGVKRVGELPVFKAFQSTNSDFVLVNREGALMDFSLQAKDLPDYLSKTLGLNSLAVKYCESFGIECSDEILMAEFEQSIESGNMANAAKAYNMLKSESREKVISSPTRLGDFLLILAKETPLSPHETEAILRDREFTMDNHSTITDYISQGKVLHFGNVYR